MSGPCAACISAAPSSANSSGIEPRPGPFVVTSAPAARISGHRTSRHRRRRREVLLHLVAPACSLVELAKAQVAVGDERAHVELMCESKGFLAGGLGQREVRRGLGAVDLAEDSLRDLG